MFDLSHVNWSQWIVTVFGVSGLGAIFLALINNLFNYKGNRAAAKELIDSSMTKWMIDTKIKLDAEQDRRIGVITERFERQREEDRKACDEELNTIKETLNNANSRIKNLEFDFHNLEETRGQLILQNTTLREQNEELKIQNGNYRLQLEVKNNG